MSHYLPNVIEICKKGKKNVHLTRVTLGGGEAKMESGHTFLRFFWNPSLTVQ